MDKKTRDSLLSRVRGAEDGSTKVLVALGSQDVDEDVLRELKALGLQVSGTAGNKLMGSIPSDRLEALESHESVLEVESSTKLRPHSKKRSGTAPRSRG